VAPGERDATPDGPGSIEPIVGPVDVALVRPLRMSVLRRGRPPEASVYPGDDHPQACHIAARLGTEVVGVGTIFPDTSPWAPDRADAWRIRGMATREGLRGRGVGHRVLGALIDHAVSGGGRFIWCEARVGAKTLYGRFGFAVQGEPFMVDEVEHVHMWRDA
jgi:predicted GNAT family N-acyltransferase